MLGFTRTATTSDERNRSSTCARKQQSQRLHDTLARDATLPEDRPQRWPRPFGTKSHEWEPACAIQPRHFAAVTVWKAWYTMAEEGYPWQSRNLP